MRKNIKRLLVGTAILGGVHLMIGPDDPVFDGGADNGPNPVQQNLLRLLAARNDYVALGDNDHRKIEIALFALNPKTLSAFHQGGVKNYFLENFANRQPAIDKVRSDPDYKYNYAAENSWLCDEERKSAVNVRFNAAVRQHPDLNIIAADQRYKINVMKGLNVFQRAAFGLPVLAYDAVYGCVRPAAIAVGAVLSLGTVTDSFMATLTDDRITAAAIGEHTGKGAIFYGAGHFRQTADGEYSMRKIFRESGKAIAVVDVFRSANEVRSGTYRDNGKDMEKPDVVFLIEEDKQHPDGIVVLNPDIQPLYEQAKREARVPKIS